jgi:protoporphyrin/coproporphyrin ferrochelatase
MTDYQAVLILSFGGPEGPDDVIPFLERVLAGKNVPRQRLEEVAHHYDLFGGVSPINDQNRALIAALQVELQENGLNLPVYWGNRNWYPLLPDTLREMRDAGITRAVAFFTSAFSSYSGCRQYLEDIERARAEVGEGAPEIDRVRVFYNHPGFIDPNIEHCRAAFEQIPAGRRDGAPLIFTAHSIPLTMAKASAYVSQLEEACRMVAEGAGRKDWRLVYQSRSGSPHQPWLSPDIGEVLPELKAQGMEDVVVMPIGFISDHMEVLYDLDTEACQIAGELGMNMVRAATVGTHPTFVRMIRELIEERMAGVQDVYCHAGCCRVS